MKKYLWKGPRLGYLHTNLIIFFDIIIASKSDVAIRYV